MTNGAFDHTTLIRSCRNSNLRPHECTPSTLPFNITTKPEQEPNIWEIFNNELPKYIFYPFFMQAMWVYLPLFFSHHNQKFKCVLYIQYYFTKIKVISIKMKNIEKRCSDGLIITLINLQHHVNNRPSPRVKCSLATIAPSTLRFSNGSLIVFRCL